MSLFPLDTQKGFGQRNLRRLFQNFITNGSQYDKTSDVRKKRLVNIIYGSFVT